MRGGLHFTYVERDPIHDLQQGDIVARTEKLESVIGLAHPYYLNAGYTHFMVLTQSCDLVNRDGGIGSPYITLAAVRPFSLAFQRAMEKFKNNNVLRRAQAISDKNRDHARRFVENLLNNNNHEYFYLHEEKLKGINDRSCAFLRLAISLKRDHYDTIRGSRVVGLEPTFQAKLGWLVGNIYSRVGTDDWVPAHIESSEWKTLVTTIMDENIVILPEKKIQHVQKVYSDEIANWTAAETVTRVLAAPEVKSRDEVIEIVAEALLAANLLDGAALTKAKSLLRSNPALKVKLPH